MHTKHIIQLCIYLTYYLLAHPAAQYCVLARLNMLAPFNIPTFKSLPKS
jgi:hypothetical protein